MRCVVLSGDFRDGCALWRGLWFVERLELSHICEKLNGARCFVVKKCIFYSAVSDRICCCHFKLSCLCFNSWGYRVRCHWESEPIWSLLSPLPWSQLILLMALKSALPPCSSFRHPNFWLRSLQLWVITVAVHQVPLLYSHRIYQTAPCLSSWCSTSWKRSLLAPEAFSSSL